MSVVFRPVPARQYNPDEVMATYLRGGWRLLERNYGATGSTVLQLKAIIGGRLADQRRQAVQVTGRKAGGRSLMPVEVL